MLKKILTAIAMAYACASFAGVDVNTASAAQLDGVRGIGPDISTQILEVRKKRNFKDWEDLIERINGIGENNASKLSREGLTVNGATYKNAPALVLPATQMKQQGPGGESGKTDNKK